MNDAARQRRINASRPDPYANRPVPDATRDGNNAGLDVHVPNGRASTHGGGRPSSNNRAPTRSRGAAAASLHAVVVAGRRGLPH